MATSSLEFAGKEYAGRIEAVADILLLMGFGLFFAGLAAFVTSEIIVAETNVREPIALLVGYRGASGLLVLSIHAFIASVLVAEYCNNLEVSD